MSQILSAENNYNKNAYDDVYKKNKKKRQPKDIK